MQESKINNVIGKRYGRLKVIAYTDRRKWREVVWKCKCDCGNIVYLTNTEAKRNKSCGCFRKEHCSRVGLVYNEVGRKIRLERMKHMYALYKGEKCLGIGSIPQLAKQFNVQLRTIQYYGTNAYKRKLEKRKKSYDAKILIDLDDSEVEQ